MKKKSIFKPFLFTAALVLTSPFVQAQEQMKIKLQLEENENGKIVKVDTVLHVKAGEDPQKVIEQFHSEMGLEPAAHISKHKLGEEDHQVSVDIEDNGSNMTISISTNGEEEVIVVPSGTDPEAIIQKHIKQEPTDGHKVIVKEMKDGNKFESSRVEVYVTSVSPEEANIGEMKAAKQSLKLSDFKLFPNPSKGKFTVSFESENRQATSIKIYNQAGSLILEKDLGKVKGKVNEELDLGNISAGIYLVQVWQDNAAQTSKVIIK